MVLYFYYGKTTGVYSFDLLRMYGLPIPFHLQYLDVPGLWPGLRHQGAHVPLPHLAARRPHRSAHRRFRHPGRVLLKMGTYGFLRFNMPLFPEAAHYFVPLFSILAIIGIIYGALVSMMQKDLKRLIAFSSVSHLGFVMLGLFTFTMHGVAGRPHPDD